MKKLIVKRILLKIIMISTLISLASCSSTSFQDMMSSFQSSDHPKTPMSTNDRTSLWDGNTAQIWDKIQRISSKKLTEMQTQTNDPIKLGWIQLAKIAKQKISTPQLATELLAWRARFPNHPANALLPGNETLMQMQSAQSPKQIAILLPQTGTHGSSGQTVREGILKAYYGNLARSNTKQNIKFYDTTPSPIVPLYQKAIADGADFIIGPLLKENVQTLSGSSVLKPTLALNYTQSGLMGPPANFYEFGLLPEDEAFQIANRARQSGLSRALIIAPQNNWGMRLVSSFSARFQALGGRIQETWYYKTPARFNQDIARLLHVNPARDKQLSDKNTDKSILEQQRRQDFDVIFLFAQPQNARLIVPLLRYYYVSTIPIYSTSAVYSGKPNPAKDVDLNGVIVCDIPSSGNTNRLYAVGQDAYLLSQSLQRLAYLPNFPIYGSTGALVLSSQHKIHRRLPCVPIQNGRLQA